jgi:phosphatidylglycerophosphate synthase
MNWRTKPSDRFVLRFIKVYISAPLSAALVHRVPTVRPTALTFAAAGLGISGGVAFGAGLAWVGGLLAAGAQLLDGMDGQVARLTGSESVQGAFLDSVLDRYSDFSLLFGVLLYCFRFSAAEQIWVFDLTPSRLILLAGLAVAGASQVSYCTARAIPVGIA